MLNLILVLIVGGLVGWVASLIMKTDAQQGIIMNIIVGIVGALLAGWLFGSVLGLGGAYSAGSLSFIGILWAIIGSVILIAILRAVRVFR